MTTDAAITEILEACAASAGRWIRISEVADRAGIAKNTLAEAITEMMEWDDFRAEPQPFGFRVTNRDREVCPVIGGEARHLIKMA